MAARLNGGSMTFTLFWIVGSTFIAPRWIPGVTLEKPRFHLGPHFAACDASLSSKPGMKKRSGAADAAPAAPTMTPVERVMVLGLGNMIACVCVMKIGV